MPTKIKMDQENNETSKLRCIGTKYNLRSRLNEGPRCTEVPTAKRKRKCFVELKALHINCLPNEMLSLIFSYLNLSERVHSVLPVCKLWRLIANGPLFWKHLKFDNHGSSEEIVKIVKRSTLLKSIELHNRNDFQSILTEIYSNSTRSRNIEEITLKMCPKKKPCAYDEDLMIRKCCTSLVCSQEVVKGGVINLPCSTNMLEYCPNLKKLALVNVIIRSKKFFTMLGVNLKLLTSLTIVNCRQFSPASLQTIAENCTELYHVTILHNNFLMGHPVDNLQKEKWNNAYHYLLKSRGRFLQVLEIDAHYIMDDTFVALSASTRLQTLSIENALCLEQKGIKAISMLRYLDHLHIHNCPCLFAETVANLFGPGNLGLLETLTMTKCCNLTDHCLEIISTSCHRINKINLSFCRQITDGGIQFLFQRCIKLRYLNLFSTKRIQGSSFQLIPQETPSLRLLIIEDYCDKIKERFTQDLIARIPNINIRRLRHMV